MAKKAGAAPGDFRQGLMSMSQRAMPPAPARSSAEQAWRTKVANVAGAPSLAQQQWMAKVMRNKAIVPPRPISAPAPTPQQTMQSNMAALPWFNEPTGGA